MAEFSDLIAEAEEVYESFFHWVKTKRPFVTGKFASSLDGLAADDFGTSQWITGDAARADYHCLRAKTQAILVGAGTANHDLPRLTARLTTGEYEPQRIVFDPWQKWKIQGALIEGIYPVIHLISAEVTQVEIATQGNITTVR